MAISLESLQRGAEKKPPRILIYGVSGIGKTTLLASAPSPVVIQTEDGLGDLEVTAFPLAKSYTDVMDALTALATEDHDFKTLGIDSLDWFEPLVWKHLITENPTSEKGSVISSIEDYGFGKGFNMALTYWRDYIDAINYLRDEVGMTIIQTAHSQIKRFDSPETDPYDRYELKLHKGAAALVQEHSDCVLFANYRIGMTKADVGFNKKVTRAIGSGERVIYTQERPAYLAKNRYSMPDTIPLRLGAEGWGELSQYIPYFNQAAAVPAAAE